MICRFFSLMKRAHKTIFLLESTSKLLFVVLVVIFYFTELNVGASSSSSDAHNVEKKTDVDFRNSQTIRPMTQPNIISIVSDSKKKIFASIPFFEFTFEIFFLIWISRPNFPLHPRKSTTYFDQIFSNSTPLNNKKVRFGKNGPK